jgi:cytochrome c oxidase assembly protein subunit 11
MTADRKPHRTIVVRLVVIMVFMFGFGYALVPLYNTFCVAFGLNGKTGVTDNRTAAAEGVDEARWVTVQFTGQTAGGLPWEFKPGQRSIKIHPGQVTDAV